MTTNHKAAIVIALACIGIAGVAAFLMFYAARIGIVRKRAAGIVAGMITVCAVLSYAGLAGMDAIVKMIA